MITTSRPARSRAHLALFAVAALAACGSEANSGADSYALTTAAADTRATAGDAVQPAEAAAAPEVAPAPATPAEADFARRCEAPGVVLCESFDAAIPERNNGQNGVFVHKMRPGAPTLDTRTRASGAGSLRFHIPSNSGPGASGAYFTNFSEDLSEQFGEGDTFYIQWRQRFSADFLATEFDGGGWKQFIVGEGDRPGKQAWSCTPIEIVVQNTFQRGYPQMYHSCGRKDGKYDGLVRRVGSSDFDYQPGGDSSCLRNGRSRNCFEYKADEWLTFQVGVTVGTWYQNDKNYARDSRIDLWAAREGSPSVHIIGYDAYDLANKNPSARYGKVWLLPYHTKKKATQAHAPGDVWYDELIISRERIADPALP